MSSTKCEYYVAVGNANVSTTSHAGSTNNLKNKFMLVSNPRIQRYGQIFPYARNAFAGSNFTPTKKKNGLTVHDDFA